MATFLPRRFVVEIAAILTTQFLCGIELFATMTIFGGFAILLAHDYFRSRHQNKSVRLDCSR